MKTMPKRNKVPTLPAVFRKYNRLYFGGKLKISAIHFKRLEDGDYGQTIWFDNCLPVIEISSHLINKGRFARIALLHEMRHVCISPDITHGPRYIKTGRKLVNLGAYDDLL